MILDLIIIALLLLLIFKIYKMYIVSSNANPSLRLINQIRRNEGFAFEASPQPTSLQQYKIYQNDYRPEVITQKGNYPTSECVQSLCKD
jgi:hypothetical protein